MNKRLKTYFMALLCFFIAFNSSCSIINNNDKEPNVEETASPEPTLKPTETPETVSEPAQGGVLNLSMRRPLTLNPLLNEDETVDKILSLIFEPLVILNEELRPVGNPAITQSVDLSADMLSVLITLRSDAVWSDGEKVRPQDVIFSIDTIRNSPENSSYKDKAANILSAKAESEFTVRISLIQPMGQFLYELCFPIIPEHYYKGASASSSKQMNPLGNGPYVFEAYSSSGSMKLKASELSMRGTPYIQDIQVMITADDESDLYAFEQGLTDAVVSTVAEWGRLRSVMSVHAVQYPSTLFDFIGFNYNNESLSDRNIREAIARCIPYDTIVETIYMNSAKLAVTPINPSSWLFDEEVKHREFNLEEAGAFAKIIQDLGVRLSFRILVNDSNSERKKIAEVLSENLAKIDIDTEIQLLPFEEYVKRINSGDYDILIGGYNLSATPDLSFMLHSKESGYYFPDGQVSIVGSNILNYKNPDMDFLIEKAFSAAGEFNAVKAFSELQNLICYETPLIGLVFKNQALLLSKRVAGPVSGALNNVFANIEKWYIIE